MPVTSLASRLARHLGSLPLVSFIIPHYNNEQFLPSAVASCVAGYPGPRQIIVVDDGSTSPQADPVLERLARAYEDVKIIRRTNGGTAAARNAGLNAVRGRYVKFLDADDLLAPDVILYQVAHLALTGVDVSLCEWLRADEPGRLLERPSRLLSDEPGFSLRDFLLRWERMLILPLHTALIHVNSSMDLPRFDERQYEEDWLFWCAIAAGGARFAVLEFPGAVYRMHPASKAHDTARMAQGFRAASQVLQQQYGALCPEMAEAHARWSEIRYGRDARSQTALCEKLRKLRQIARLDGPWAALLSLSQFLWRKVGLPERWWPRRLPSAGHLALRRHNPAEKLCAALAAESAVPDSGES